MNQSHQMRLCAAISLLGGSMGAVLAIMLAISGLNASAGDIFFGLICCLTIWAGAVGTMLRWPLFRRKGNLALAALMLFLGLCLRLSLFDYESPDYVSFLSVWTETMRNMTVRQALTTPIGDYNMPYLYLILLISRLPFRDVYCIKVFSVLADVASALAVAWIVRRLTKREGAALLALIAALFCPTTWLNSAYWGQCDSVYGALGLWGLYCGLRKKSWQCWLLFALSLSFKLQAVFLLPMLVLFMVTERVRLKDVWVFPAGFVGASAPALLAGRSLADTFSIYVNQTQSYPYLSLNAPSFWSLIDNGYYSQLAGAPVLLAMGLCLCLLLCLLWRYERLDAKRLLNTALVFSLMIPWLLPKMHERYFYFAELLSLVYGALYPRRIAVPVILMTGGFLIYSQYLFGGMAILSLRLVAVIYGVLLLYLLAELLRDTGKKPSCNMNLGGNEDGTHGISLV